LLDTSATRDNVSIAGAVTLVGDLDNTVEQAGALAVNNVDAHHQDTSNGTGGSITIAGYTNVTVGNLYTYTLSPNYNAGSVSITRIAGDIKVTGNVRTSAKVAGNVTLATESGSGGSITIDGAINLDGSTADNERDLSLTSDYRITLASLNLGQIRRVSFSVHGGVARSQYWVWILSEPVGLTTVADEAGNNPQNVSGFYSVDSHVYYTDGVDGLSGNYDILESDGVTDSGFDLIGLVAGEAPPELRAGGLFLFR
jgi:hypothetical protein